ncbi:MAG: hypothetical protein M1816_000042 [Peltula sp. TS41687]|nr:MAG: hypothetical protein M1816_000042 [Peltula sp. TS41687]
MATLGTTAVVAYLSLSGKKASKTDGPPINASSSDEERFIREFVKSAQQEGDKKQKH